MPKNKLCKTRPGHSKRIQNKIEAASRLNPFIKEYIHKIETENERMKTDPETTVGQLIPQMRDAITQNKRLSVLAATLIESNGGRVTLSKAALEAFESKVLSIKWELPEGVTDPATAEEFVFLYEATAQEGATPIQETPDISEELLASAGRELSE